MWVTRRSSEEQVRTDHPCSAPAQQPFPYPRPCLLQALLGTPDLGQVYFEPVRDKHGNALLVLLREVEGCALEGLRWTSLSKLQIQRKPISPPDEPTALDTLLITLHEKLAYHRRSRKLLAPGLYLGYVKLCSSVEQIRVLVPHKIPNVFCHVKIRDNSHVSREEWQWLQSVRSLEDTEDICADEQSAPHRLLLELRNAAKELLGRINIPNNQLEHPHTVPADGAVGVEVEGHQVFWTCEDKPFISVLTTVPPHTDSLGVSTKTKAGLVTEDDPLPF
ncbi:hypothetical protein NFI96_004218 [Prochilodus magdalenae]|nr:hypothetical protein NFI96_004218 [Prochilodus magdalenae]